MNHTTGIKLFTFDLDDIMVVQFYFLGLFDLRCDQQALKKPPTQKSQSLLAYLVLNRQQPHLRDHLVNLFWGERPQKKARRSLTTALWHLRTCLPQGEFILSDYSSVQFNPNKRVWVDVDEFNKCIHTNAMEDWLQVSIYTRAVY